VIRGGDVAVVVPAAGLGTRLGTGTPKAMRELDGTWLLGHAVRRLGQAQSVGCIVVAAPSSLVDDVRRRLRTEVAAEIALVVVSGGRTRQESVRHGLGAVPVDYQIVLVHDAARALAPPDLVERVAAVVRAGRPAVIPVLPVVDTIKQVDETGQVVATVDRIALRAVQTPQGFQRQILEDAHRDETVATDDAGLVERLGIDVVCVAGDAAAFKITTQLDLALAQVLLRSLHAPPGA
jgi:2-C-methyl-D-erythritol 4-phosphate cytidylyltransferase